MCSRASNSAARRRGSKCAAISSRSASGAMPDISPTRRAWASARPTMSAFCSPVEALDAGACFGPSQTVGRKDAARSACGRRRRRGRDCLAKSPGSGPPLEAPDRRGQGFDLAFERELRPGKGEDRRARRRSASRDGARIRGAPRRPRRRVRPPRARSPRARKRCARPLPADGCARAAPARTARPARRDWGRSPARSDRGTDAARLAGPANSGSIAGVSQTIRTWSQNAREEATAARSMRFSRSASSPLALRFQPEPS